MNGEAAFLCRKVPRTPVVGFGQFDVTLTGLRMSRFHRGFALFACTASKIGQILIHAVTPSGKRPPRATRSPPATFIA